MTVHLNPTVSSPLPHRKTSRSCQVAYPLTAATLPIQPIQPVQPAFPSTWTTKIPISETQPPLVDIDGWRSTKPVPRSPPIQTQAPHLQSSSLLPLTHPSNSTASSNPAAAATLSLALQAVPLPKGLRSRTRKGTPRLKTQSGTPTAISTESIPLLPTLLILGAGGPGTG